MYLEVTKNETVKKNDNEYVQSSFSPVKDWLPNGKAILMGDSCMRIYNVGKEHPVGSIFEGRIHKFATTPYTIDNDGTQTTVNKMTIVVLANENAIALANAQLAKRGACVLDAQGQPTVQLEQVSKPDASKGTETGTEEPKTKEEPAGTKK